MGKHDENTGLIGVGFLFGMIAVFLLEICLEQTGYFKLASMCGLAGSALVCVLSARFLLKKWQTQPDFAENGDVPFCGAVLLLSSMTLIASLVRVAGLHLSKVAPLFPVLLASAAIPVRTFLRKLRRLP